MDYIYGVILGLLDGFGEVFPVSRVGHRAMLERLAVIPSALAENEALELLLRMGVLAGVILAFRKTVWRMITGFADMAGGIFTGRFRWQKAGRYQRMALLALLGAVPTLLLAWLRRYYDFAVALQGNLIFTGVMLLVMAGLIYIGTHSICHNWTMTDMNAGHALKLGLFRAAAEWLSGLSPIGISLSMGRNMGFTGETALEYAFALCVPSMLGSCLFDVGALESAGALPWGVTAAAVLAAGLAAWVAALLVKLLMKKNRYGWCAVYCLLAGAAAIVLNFLT